MREIILDTETTGLDPKQGHRVIEIGAVELVNRRLTGNSYHTYINPERQIDPGALKVHGITNQFLIDKPLFAQIVDEFLQYVKGAQLVIHNAPFDLGFLDHELRKCRNRLGKIKDYCTHVDTLELARKKHPGQKNNLDALCKRYEIDNSHRDLHGALLDAEILAHVYLAMTGGQSTLFGGDSHQTTTKAADRSVQQQVDREGKTLVVIKANEQELADHDAYMEKLQ